MTNAVNIRLQGEQIVVLSYKGLLDRLESFDNRSMIFEEKFGIGRGWDAMATGSQTVVVYIKGTNANLPAVFSVVNSKTVQLSQHNKELVNHNLSDGSLIEIEADD